MKHFIFILVTVLSMLLFSCNNTPKGEYPDHIDLNTVTQRNQSITSMENGSGYNQNVLKIAPGHANNQVLIWKEGDPVNLNKANYLVCEIWHNNTFSGVINVNFYKKGKQDSGVVTQSGQSDPDPQISAKIGILPELKTQMIFPLSFLDAQDIFLDRYPRQLKGTVLGNRLKVEDISRITLNFAPYKEPHFTPEFEIASISLREELPEAYPKPEVPLADQFGQWARKEWPGKTKNEEELKQMNDSLLDLAREAHLPNSRSKYGGWKEKQFEATGYFRTHHDGKRWWLVDPNGYAFLSVGVDGMGPSASGMTEGQEDLLKWMPEKGDPLLGEALYERNGENTMVDYFKTNLMRVFGEQWKTKWDTITSGLMQQYRFNTIANWSDIQFARKMKKPYVLPLSNFPSTEIKLYRDFPDVFAPEYKEEAKSYAAQLKKYKNDPWLIGYFLRNEPNWAFGEHNLAFEMFVTDQQSHTKERFVEWIASTYSENISELNDAWGLNLNNFEELHNKVFDEMPNETARKDFYRFSERMVEQYVDVPCDEVEKVDPNHLNLGMRYAWISSDLLYKAGERFDVFSINGYSNPGPPGTKEIARRSGKPVMIGEFHFGAVDRGLPATGIQAALSQEARGTAYRYYVEQGFTRPELVGIHYFTWTDQPIFGRFDGENYNIGFVDICNRPYPELTEAATKTNKRIYEVATGQIKPFDKTIEKIPPVHY
ncbi:MAG: beta-galactosidase [Bacteroidales bacterium]|nr:beta-galactosidase [Bacteroidales bacterium]